MKRKLCILKKCERPVITRGLCGSDYAWAANLVKWQGYLWRDFEAWGLSLKPTFKKSPAPNFFEEALDKIGKGP